MARLGSHKRPVIVRVQTQEHADEIIELCSANDWQLIVGVEPDVPEDITDLLKLLHPERFTLRVETTSARNDPCPCGSRIKYKKCCLRSPHQGTTTSRQS